ncbi:MAG: shikimate kinase, partial [Actinomycetota bacterium]
MPRVVVLVGMMGSGKTTVGRRVAAKLGYKFIDTDDLVVARAGKSVREVFEHDGEAMFRAHEAQALAEALSTSVDAVVAAAGGSVLSAENRMLLRSSSAVVLWLDADVPSLTERTARSPHRPLLDGDASARLTQLD